MSPERSVLFESTQIGPEVTFGTSVAASKKLLATSFEVGPEVDIATFRPNGYKYDTIASLNTEWVGINQRADVLYGFGVSSTTRLVLIRPPSSVRPATSGSLPATATALTRPSLTPLSRGHRCTPTSLRVLW